MGFSSIEEGLKDLREGKMIIVVDDEGRENEGDLVLPAESATQENEKRLVFRYVRTRNIGQIVAFLSFLEVCLPDELQQIINQGADYIKPVLYEKGVIISKDREFAREIASVTIYRKDSELQTEPSYIMMEKQRFINRFLNPKYDLHRV